MKSNKELSKMKIVGNEPTHFEFTAKAEQIYANTDPLRIYELYDEDEDRYYYCLRGVFEDCGKNEWIGPRVCNVWGLPKKKMLKSASQAEQAEIVAIAEEIWSGLE